MNRLEFIIKGINKNLGEKVTQRLNLFLNPCHNIVKMTGKGNESLIIDTEVGDVNKSKAHTPTLKEQVPSLISLDMVCRCLYI